MVEKNINKYNKINKYDSIISIISFFVMLTIFFLPSLLRCKLPEF